MKLNSQDKSACYCMLLERFCWLCFSEYSCLSNNWLHQFKHAIMKLKFKYAHLLLRVLLTWMYYPFKEIHKNIHATSMDLLKHHDIDFNNYTLSS